MLGQEGVDRLRAGPPIDEVPRGDRSRRRPGSASPDLSPQYHRLIPVSILREATQRAISSRASLMTRGLFEFSHMTSSSIRSNNSARLRRPVPHRRCRRDGRRGRCRDRPPARRTGRPGRRPAAAAPTTDAASRGGRGGSTSPSRRPALIFARGRPLRSASSGSSGMVIPLLAGRCFLTTPPCPFPCQ